MGQNNSKCAKWCIEWSNGGREDEEPRKMEDLFEEDEEPRKMEDLFEAKIKQFLRKKRSDFTKKITLEGQLLNKLQEEAITPEQYQTIQATPGITREKNECLLDILGKRLPKHIKTFYVTLTEIPEEESAAQILEEMEPTLRIHIFGNGALTVQMNIIESHTKRESPETAQFSKELVDMMIQRHFEQKLGELHELIKITLGTILVKLKYGNEQSLKAMLHMYDSGEFGTLVAKDFITEDMLSKHHLESVVLQTNIPENTYNTLKQALLSPGHAQGKEENKSKQAVKSADTSTLPDKDALPHVSTETVVESVEGQIKVETRVIKKYNTGKPALAVFAGKASTIDGVYKSLKRVFAAPITPHGLEGGYSQVSAIPQIPNPTTQTAVARRDNQVWVIGGIQIGRYGRDALTSSCWVLDLDTWQWTEGPQLHTPRYEHTVTAVGGALVAVGGQDGSNTLSSCETETGTGRWTPAPDLGQGRNSHAACEWNGRVVVSGGWTGNNTRLSSVTSWTPGERSWRDEPPLSGPRSGHAMCAVGSRLVLCGGKDGNNKPVNTIEEYSPEAGVWSKVADLPHHKYCAAAVVHGDALYIVGGDYSASTLRYQAGEVREDRHLPWDMGRYSGTFACVITLPASQ